MRRSELIGITLRGSAGALDALQAASVMSKNPKPIAFDRYGGWDEDRVWYVTYAGVLVIANLVLWMTWN